MARAYVIDNIQADNAGIKVPPPLIYLAGFTIGLILQRFIPFMPLNWQMRWWGAILILAGAFFMVTALSLFRQNKNSPIPDKPVTTLLRSGVYNTTRNPMYLGMLLSYLGLAWLMGIIWALFVAVAVFFIINQQIIPREEQYLTRKFGDEYINYVKSVRRWL
ncbi:MAG: isoprenylcysteine carboxylmethyltransferase family protein [Patescibacteria group bacterium]|jgi:protein-S-isoprenylcysteine O-methyltransferase Ste14